MAIEPLGSMMTIQSQSASKPAETKPATGNTEVSTPAQAANVDPVTVSVQKVENKDGQNAGSQGNEQQAQNEQQVPNEQLKKAVEQMNKNMIHAHAVFGFHDKTNRVMIKIVDKDTKEVIREYPPEETLDMIAKVWELAGILVDEKR